MIHSLLLLLDIDGTLCPLGPGPDVAMRQLSIGSGSVSFRADLPEVLVELAARYELAWATAWQDSANLLLAPALGLPALPVIRFTDLPADELGLGHTGRSWKLPGGQAAGPRRARRWSPAREPSSRILLAIASRSATFSGAHRVAFRAASVPIPVVIAVG